MVEMLCGAAEGAKGGRGGGGERCNINIELNPQCIGTGVPQKYKFNFYIPRSLELYM